MQHVHPVFEKATAVISLNALFRMPLPNGETRPMDADNTLNDIIQWAIKTNAFDQRAAYGNDMDRYHITLHHVPKHGAGIVQTFHFKDFLLSWDRPDSFEDMMWRLDRDRLGNAMRNTLVEKFGLETNPDAPMFWRRDIRQCSHPDYMKLHVQPVASIPHLIAA